MVEQLKARLLKDGLDPATFARLKQAAIDRQAWAVQGNSALADYYWSALGDFDNGRFSDPAKRLKAVSLEQANLALRQLLQQPGYLRIEQPLLSDEQLLWLIGGLLSLVLLGSFGVYLLRHRAR